MQKLKGRTVIEGQSTLSKASIADAEIEGVDIVLAEDLAEAGLTISASESVPVRRVTLTLSSAVLTVTDGDAAGGYFGYKLADVATNRALLLGCRAVMEIEASSEEITQDAADCELTIGTKQQTDGGTIADDDQENDLTTATWTTALVDGAAGPTTVEGPYSAPHRLAATAAIYLNSYIPDASISGEGTMTVSLTLQLLLLDLGGV